MAFELNGRTLDNLHGTPSDLASVLAEGARLCPDTHYFIAYAGARTRATQRANMASGASQTMNSAHLRDDNGVHYAVDILPFVWTSGRWRKSWAHADYHPVVQPIFEAASRLGIPIDWGGHWTTLVDFPHVALDRRFYPRDALQHSTHLDRRMLGVTWNVDPGTGRYIDTRHGVPARRRYA